METTHKIVTADSRNLSILKHESIDLVVTSPPYPMIQMWDELFSKISPNVKLALEEKDGDSAFESMHQELDKTWKELYRLTKPGSLVCINIGDATRTIGKKFKLYSNHSRIIESFRKIGFETLPVILWRKQTNAPNKFMGSGMLSGGAYVTLEHEYILIFRKGGKREFNTEELKQKRRESAFFWEERNCWFSDLWDFKGISQKLSEKKLRERSGAYPFELPYRLVNMYSIQDDVILDPFTGTGTTTFACMGSGRNSIGVDIDENISNHIFQDLDEKIKQIGERLENRLSSHILFIEEYCKKKGEVKYLNRNLGFPVVTRQETDIQLNRIFGVERVNDEELRVTYTKEDKQIENDLFRLSPQTI